MSFCDFINRESNNKVHEHVKNIAKAIDYEMINNIDKKRILMVSMPPRSLKTTIGFNFFASYLAKVYSETKSEVSVSLTSYNAEMCNINARNSTLVQASDQSNINFLNRPVGYNAAGPEFDFMIFDDCFKSFESCLSNKHSAGVIDWFKQFVISKSKPNAFILILNTRFGNNDVIGTIREELPGWMESFCVKDIVIQAINQETFFSFWPEGFHISDLFKIKDVIGDKCFEIMYQGKV